MLRLTAKSTQFGRKTFTSWLIESAGTVPLKRRKDYEKGSINDTDNSEVMDKLMEVSILGLCSLVAQLSTLLEQALEMGDAICFFPEGGRWVSIVDALLRSQNLCNDFQSLSSDYRAFENRRCDSIRHLTST
jgi:1-acyl-sn-glycerol-3-phosphate acyltransferase